nr:hypothetical protein [Tanacetum cinerariifolium]
KLTKKAYGWDENSSFLVPDEARHYLRDALLSRNGGDYDAWQETFARFEKDQPALADELKRMRAGEMPEGWRNTALRSRQLRRPQLAFRHPRTRHGLDCQRSGAVLHPAIHVDLPGLQRLHEAADSSGLDHGTAGGV